MPPPSRRSFLQGLAGVAVLGASRGSLADPISDLNKIGTADSLVSRSPPDFTVLDLTVEGDKTLGTRFTLFVPKHLAKDERVPLLVLLHGLGETWDQGIGVYAWVERYGLGHSYGRLRRPPIVRTSRQLHLFTDAHLAEINTSLAASPFKGMAIACPFTPNAQRLPNPPVGLDNYAAWLTDVVIPRARKEAPVFTDAAHTAIDGVSLGGQLALEVFVRKPDHFAAVGAVQAGINVVRLQAYADKIAAAWAKVSAGKPAGAKFVHIQTSLADPFHDVNVALAGMLQKKSVPIDLAIIPGLHDQIYLREAGGIEMLLWHDRRPR